MTDTRLEDRLRALCSRDERELAEETVGAPPPAAGSAASAVTAVGAALTTLETSYPQAFANVECQESAEAFTTHPRNRVGRVVTVVSRIRRFFSAP